MDVKPSTAILAALAAAQSSTARPASGPAARSDGVVLARAVGAARADETLVGDSAARRQRQAPESRGQRPPPLDSRLGRLVDITV